MKFPMFLIAAFFALTGALRAETITVFAASSMKDALEDVAAVWSDDSGIDVVFSFASSSALARQIMQGAPADLFVSANEDWMDQIEASNLIIEGTRVDIAGNTLVLVSSGGADPVDLAIPTDLIARLEGRPLAMGLVEAVPAGIYGKAALEHLGLWDALAPLVAQTANSRAALRLVQITEARLGIVYATDALVAPDLDVVAVFPAQAHAPIRYPAAVLRTPNAVAATDFLYALRSAQGQAIFARLGFTGVAADG